MALEFSTPVSAASIAVANGQSPSLAYKLPMILGAGGGGTVNTGTAEVALATVTVPANLLGPNGQVRIFTSWTFTNSVNNKTLRVRFGGIGGTAYLSAVFTTSATYADIRVFGNNGATNAQKGFGTNSGGLGSSTSALVTGAIDTTASQTIVISGQPASAGESVVLEQYIVEYIPAT